MGSSLPTKALLLNIRWALAVRRMLPADAFRIFDTNGIGYLNKRKLVRGLEWLGLTKKNDRHRNWMVAQVAALFDAFNENQNEAIDEEEFKACLELKGIDWESLSNAQWQAGTNPIDPNPDDGPEPTSEEEIGQPVVRLAPGMCRKLNDGRFSISWVFHSHLKCVWNTKTTLAEKPMSIWTQDRRRNNWVRSATTFLGSNISMRLNLGHIATAGLSEPKSVPVLEVKDVAQSGPFKGQEWFALHQFMDTFFPHPVQYHQTWVQHSRSRKRRTSMRSGNDLFVWEPVPPSDDFVALGMLATADGAKPDRNAMRCVPRQWAERCKSVGLLWSDVSTTSSPAGFWSGQVPGGLFRVTVGAEAKEMPVVLLIPTDPFFCALPGT